MSVIEDAAFDKYRDMSNEKIGAVLRVLEKHYGGELVDWMDDDSDEINIGDESYDGMLNEVLSVMTDDDITTAMAELEALNE